ncbi:MAG TPA: transposase [Thermoanaerobaculia bacterium]|nr:transposase [Thermoanaerobaculia bacterium]
MFLHIVFGTKEQFPFITPDIRPRLHAYLATVIRGLGADALVIGGVEDHVHGLIRLPSPLPYAELLEKAKGNSSRWFNKTVPCGGKFRWQRGYGAFSVSYSNLSRVRRYIENQEEHHRKMTFTEEVQKFLLRHAMEFDLEDLKS